MLGPLAACGLLVRQQQGGCQLHANQAAPNRFSVIMASRECPITVNLHNMRHTTPRCRC